MANGIITRPIPPWRKQQQPPVIPAPVMAEQPPAAVTRMPVSFEELIRKANLLSEQVDTGASGKVTAPYSQALAMKAQAGITPKPTDEYTAQGKTELPTLTWLNRVDELKNKPTQLVPFVGSGVEIFTLGKLMKTALDLEKGVDISEEDMSALYKFIEKGQRETDWGYKVADVVAQLPAFALELLLTGGIFTAGKLATVKASTVALNKLATKTGLKVLEGRLAQLGVKAAGVVVGGTLQTLPAGATRIPLATLEKQLMATLTGDEEAVWKSAVKSVGEQWVETVSERTGGMLTSLTGAARGKLVKMGLLKALQKTNPGKSSADLQKLMNGLGYNGIFGEMFEERIGEVAHGVLQNIGMGNQEYQLPSWEQLSVELVAFAVPGAAFKAAERLQEIDLSSERGSVSLGGELTPEGIPKTEPGQPEAGLQPTTPEVTKALTHKEFIAQGKTEAEWDIYAAEQNRLSRERGQQQTIELWQGEGVSGNDIANLLRTRGVSIPPAISQGLQHSDTVVSSTSVTGRGMSRAEASTIHKWVSGQMGKPAIPKAEVTPVTPEVTPTEAPVGGKQIVKYEKGSVGDAVRAAKELKAKENLYVYPTAEGMAIGRQPPPFGIQHIIVKPDGTHQVVAAGTSFEAGRQAGIEPVAPTEVIATPQPTPTAPVAGVTPVEAVAPTEGKAPPPPKPPAPPTPTTPEQPAPAIKPEPNLGEMKRIIEQATAVVKQDRPGRFTKILERIPGIKQVIEFERPGLKMTGDKEKILIAHVAESEVRSDVATRAVGSRANLTDELKDNFGRDAMRGAKTKVKFTGNPEQAKNPITGTLKDIADNPELYDLSVEQKAVLTKLDMRNEELLNLVIDGYGAEIGRYPAKEGGAFLPNVDVSEDAIEAIGGEMRAVASGRQKTRFYPSARDRMASDKTFKPELDVTKLLDGMDRSKASAAAGQTFREVIGGKTRLEVMQETHPQLAEKMVALRKRLTSLRGSAGRLDEKLDKAITDFMASPIEGQDMTQLQASLDVKLKAGPRAGMGKADIQKEIDGVRAQIKALKPAWEVANLKPYQFVQEGIYRYFPADQAKLVMELRKTSNNPFLNFIENIRGTAFSGDLSPIVGVQTPVGILADPVGAFMQAGGGLAKAIKNNDPFVSFKVNDLAKDIEKDTEGWAQFFSLLGRAPSGTPQEFAGGYLSKIPGFSAFTESTFVLVTRQAKNLYDMTYKSLMKFGMPELDAKIAAVTTASRVFPFLNPQRLGQSPARQTLLRAFPTSYSFIRKPAEMMVDAAKGFAKLGTLQKPRATEWMAMKVIATMAATAMVVAAVSAAMDADRKKTDVKKAILDAINPDPMNGKFLSIVAGNYRIPIGGPYRGLFRAIYPQKVQGVSFPVPFAGIVNYLNNRVNPAIRAQIDLLKNQDYYGQKIRTGDVPHQILQILAYEIESALPLTAGSAIEAWRTKMSKEEAISQSVGQFAGVNVIENKWYEVQTFEEQYSKQDYGKTYDELNKSEKAELLRNHDDLKQAIDIANESRRSAEPNKTYNLLAEQAVTMRNTSLNKAAQALLDGQITKKDYDDQRGYIRPYYSGQRNALWQMKDQLAPEETQAQQQRYDESVKPEDKAMDDYQQYYSELISQSELPIDWDKIDIQINAFLNQYDASTRNYIIKHKDDWILDIPEPAKTIEQERLQGIEDGTWWDNYREAEAPATTRQTVSQGAGNRPVPPWRR